jgi:betaine-aldehyde dehydrogenase
VTLLGQFIDGRHVPGNGASVEVTNPADGSTVAVLGEATVADVDAAVAAARRAYPGWSRATPGERSAALLALADRMEARAEEYARVETAQTGKPIRSRPSSTSPGSVDNVRSSPAQRGCSTGWPRRSTPGPHLLDPPRADRRRGVDRAVELPAADGGLEGPAGGGGREHHRPQAREITPLTSLMLAEACASRHPGWRRQRAHRPRTHRRRGADQPPGRRPWCRSPGRRRSAGA